MNFCPDLYAFLAAAVTVPVYADPAPNNSESSFVTYDRQEAVPNYTFSGQGTLWESRYAIYCLAKRVSAANDLAAEIATALKPFAVSGVIGTHQVFTVQLEDLVHIHEKETELHRVALNYVISYHEE